jgi:hypothetical protein
MRSDEFHKCDASAEIESDYHPKIAASDFESRTFSIQNFRIRSGQTYILH